MKFPLISKHYNEAYRFAKLNGLEVTHGMKAEQVFDIIRTAFPGIEEFDLEGEEPAARSALAPAAQAVGDPTHYRNDPTIEINIQNNPENGGSQPVPVCVNGDHITIQRNQWITIPYRFYKALELAVQKDWRQEPNAVTGKPDTIIEDRNAYQYGVRNPPTREEIAAWEERTRNIGRDKTEDASLKAEQSDAVLDKIAGKLLDKLQQAAA